MANARVIQKNFWNCPRIAKYSIKSRYFLIGLASVAEDYGRFWYNVRNIKSQIYPTDSTSLKWIREQLKIFIQDGVLCEYEVDGQKYLHFIDWFAKGFALKQRLDHPKDDQLPDCKIHLMQAKNTRKKRETSRPIQSNLNKSNLYQSSGSKRERVYQPHEYKDDTTGNAKLGYCAKCGKVNTYSPYDVKLGDTKCCKAQIMPIPPTKQLNHQEVN